MKYSTFYILLLALFVVTTSSAQYSSDPNDSLILVPAGYLALLEAKVHATEDIETIAEEDLSHAFMDGEERVALFDYTITPMYFTDKLQLSLPADESFTMKIQDENGEVVMTHPSIFGINQLNLSHLAPGVYHVTLKSYMGKTEDTIIKL